MKGTRIPDVRRDRRRGWTRWDRIRRGRRELVAEPGSYMRVLDEEGALWCWYVRSPDGDVGTLWENVHQVTEHEGGAITVSPSIVMPKGWHGWLQAGQWSSV